MTLIQLNQDWQSAFQTFYHDFATHDPENSEPYQQGAEDFSAYLEKLKRQKKPEKEEREPISYYWLTDGAKILGAIGIRHTLRRKIIREEVGHIGYDIAPSYRNQGLGKALLKLGLDKAKEMGLSEVLIVADERNIASRKVIEHNGGQLQDIIVGELGPEPAARYWVSLVQN